MDSVPEPAPRPAPRHKVAPRPAPRPAKSHGVTSEPETSSTSLSTQNASETEQHASVQASSVEAIVGALAILKFGSDDADLIVKRIEVDSQEKRWEGFQSLVVDCRALQAAGEGEISEEVRERLCQTFSSMSGKRITPTQSAPSAQPLSSTAPAPAPMPKPRPQQRPRPSSIPRETPVSDDTSHAPGPTTPKDAVTPTLTTPSVASSIDAIPETQAVPVPEQAKQEKPETSTTSLEGTGGAGAAVVPAVRPKPKPRPMSLNVDDPLSPTIASPLEAGPRPAPRDRPEKAARRYSSMENTTTTANALLSPVHPPSEDSTHVENGDIPPPKPPRRVPRQSEPNLAMGGGSSAGRSLSVPLNPQQPKSEDLSGESGSLDFRGSQPVPAPRPAPRPRPFSYHEGVNKDMLRVGGELLAEKMSETSERAEKSDTDVVGGSGEKGGESVGEKGEHNEGKEGKEGKEKEHGGEKAGTKKHKLGMGGLLRLVDWKNKAAKKAKANSASQQAQTM